MAHPLAVEDFAGRMRVEPSAYSKADLQKEIIARLASIRDVYVLGEFNSGEEDVPYEFQDVAELERTLDPDGLDEIGVRLCKRIKNPSPDVNGANTIFPLRVGSPTVGTLELVETATPVLTVTSQGAGGYGVLALFNGIKIETGTNEGKKISLGYRNGVEHVQDDLGVAFDIQYTGAGTAALMTIVVASDLATTLTLTVDAVEVPGGVLDLTQPEYSTLNEVVAQINGLDDWTCTVSAYNPGDMPSSYLDAVVDEDVKTASYTALSILGSIIHWFEQNVSRLSIARESGQTTAPDNIDWTFLDTGGAYAARIAGDWTTALGLIEQAEAPGGIIFAVTDDSAIQAAVQSWINDQKTTHNRIWRSFFGHASGTVDPADPTAVNGATLALSSRRNSVVCQRWYERDSDGVLQTREPLELAALLCGAAAGVRPGDTLTLKRLRIDGLKDTYTLAQRENLMKGGNTVLKIAKGAGYKIAFALTSDTGDSRMRKVLSEAMAADRIEHNLYTPLKLLVGTWATKDKVVNAEGLAVDTMEQLRDEGTITDGWDEDGNVLPAYQNPVVTLQAGAMTVTVGGMIGGEIDQIGAAVGIEYQKFGVSVTA